MMTKAWLSARQQNFQPLGADPDEILRDDERPLPASGVPSGGSGAGAAGGQGGSDDEAAEVAREAAAAARTAAAAADVAASGAEAAAGGGGGGGSDPTAAPHLPWKPAEVDSITRRIDDARALIPYIFGAFKHPNRHGLRLGLPMLQYYGPEIDLKTGRWTNHVGDTLNLVAKILHVSGKLPFSVLLLGHRPDSAEKSKFAISSFLKAIDKVEGQIQSTLESQKGNIVKNYTGIRKRVLECMSEQLARFPAEEDGQDEESRKANKAKWNEITQAIRMSLIDENAKEMKACESINLGGAFGYDNSAFYGTSLVDFILKVLKNHEKTEYAAILTEVHTEIEAQEQEEIKSIILTIASLRKVYQRTRSAFEAQDNLLTSFESALLNTAKKNVNFMEEEAQHAAIEDYLKHFLFERVELLYCNIYTFFTAMI